MKELRRSIYDRIEKIDIGSAVQIRLRCGRMKARGTHGSCRYLYIRFRCLNGPTRLLY